MLVTGGAGFIGSNLLRRSLEAGHEVACLDALTYAGSFASIADLEASERFSFVHGDIRDGDVVGNLLKDFKPDVVLNLAAETHVDRSIDAPAVFVETNVGGTLNLLECACRYRDAMASEMRDAFKFIQVSTDEVYGSCTEGAFSETSPLRPNSPYSASKAGGDHLVSAYSTTYGLSTTITRCSNNYGPFQFPEKLIPMIIWKALRNEPIPIYGDGQNVRDWIYVADHCDALICIATENSTSTEYLIGTGQGHKNLEIAERVCKVLDHLNPRSGGAAFSDLITFTTDRPGHDFRYAVDPTKISDEHGWRPTTDLESGLLHTVKWYLENPAWVDAVSSGGNGGARLGLSRYA